MSFWNYFGFKNDQMDIFNDLGVECEESKLEYVHNNYVKAESLPDVIQRYIKTEVLKHIKNNNIITDSEISIPRRYWLCRNIPYKKDLLGVLNSEIIRNILKELGNERKYVINMEYNDCKIMFVY